MCSGTHFAVALRYAAEIVFLKYRLFHIYSLSHSKHILTLSIGIFHAYLLYHITKDWNFGFWWSTKNMISHICQSALFFPLNSSTLKSSVLVSSWCCYYFYWLVLWGTINLSHFTGQIPLVIFSVFHFQSFCDISLAIINKLSSQLLYIPHSAISVRGLSFTPKAMLAWKTCLGNLSISYRNLIRWIFLFLSPSLFYVYAW